MNNKDNNDNSDDFFKNLFNDDFFKNHLDGLDASDFTKENGDIDYDKLRKESFKMFEELTGKNVSDLFDIDSISIDKLLPPIDDNKVGMGFVQDLNSDEGKSMFDDLVKKHNLTKDSNIVDVDGEEYVSEIWTNKEGTVNVKRMYKLNDETSSIMLTKEEQIELYEDKMEDAVDIEDYEEAARLRDLINSIKNA